MILTLERPTIELGAGGGGMNARRAVIRWAWRLFRREWRQQLLVLAMIVVAVAAVFIGATVATTTKAAASNGFGTAQDQATFQGSPAQISSDIAKVHQRFGTVDVIENENQIIPGSINTYAIRAQNPRGAYGTPMLQLLSGHYPSGAGQVDMTPTLASDFHLRVGDVWHEGGQARTLVGLVQNPQSLLDEFALVPPGQVTHPGSATVLFDARGYNVQRLGSNFESVAGVAAASTSNGPLNPTTILLALTTIGMLLIALVAVGGFTVLAQRRMRSIGMLGSLGATDRNISLVVQANGIVVGVVGAILGTIVGFLGWLAYRPHAEQSAHHLIGVFALPWDVIVPSMVLAMLATWFAASRPARTVTHIPIVAALSGRPPAPREVHRSAVPGVLAGVIGFLLLGVAGAARGGGGTPELVFGLVVLVAAVILLSPLCLTVLARLGRRLPIAVRLAFRDLARYRARSGSALSAISLGVLIAVIICVVAAARYSDVLDYAGPNLASNQLMLYTPNGPNSGPGPTNVAHASFKTMDNAAHSIAAALGTHDPIEIEGTSAGLQHAGSGRQWNGPVYVATPQLLHAFGISASQINPNADILTMRPGVDTLSGMQLVYGNYFGGKGGGGGVINVVGPNQSGNSYPCPAGSCIANPPIQEVNALPAGTSAPNTVITEHAVHTLHLASSLSVTGWMIQTPNVLTAAQIRNAQQAASAAGLSVETKNDEPTSSEIINWATVFGIALALAVLAMTVGLIRSETASDLQTLSATGASSFTRRTLTAATAGGLGFLGALLGTAIGYVAAAGFFEGSPNNGGIGALSNAPTTNLLIILVGMPLAATAIGFLLAGRQPSVMSRQPLE